jgi:GH15 family glucan-1,4-alpha-glucosidase
LRAVAGDPDKMRIMYRIDGARRLEEWVAPWLPGVRWTGPVRIGNAAASQLQLDIYGELMDVLHLSHEAGIPRTAQARELVRALTAHVCQVWREPDKGFWEPRGKPRQHVYSKVSAWVAIDRAIGMRRSDGDCEGLPELLALRDEMHAEICREGYDQGLGSFVSFYGSEQVDASLLLLPVVGFLPVEDPRMDGTIRRIEQRLVQDGLVRRLEGGEHDREGAFLACACWLAECQARQGRIADARRTFERVLATANDLGLIAEEYDVTAQRLAGNFPQALTHLAVVQTALLLSGPVLQRGASGESPKKVAS